MSRALQGATVLVTGGTGSFGRRVASVLLERGPREVRIFSRDEKKQSDMRRTFPEFTYVLGDVRDLARLHEVMAGVTHVFHAAALKQVPSCEAFPLEALKTNALGSDNVCRAAVAAGVRSVVALSTDKAVKPVNAMGLSKAVMERIVCARNGRADVETTFACVRYGNVMGSRGSVIPLFRRQCARGEPLSVTSPDMTRFLLTLDDAVDLVLHALTRAQGGEVFVRKAPACDVLTLARAVARRHSRLGIDHPIEVVGVRPGEKIHEVLVNEYELARSTEDESYYTVHPEYRRPAASIAAVPGWEYTSENTTRLVDPDQLAALLERAEVEEVEA